MNVKPNVIVDLDGTLADCTHRLHHIQGEHKDWDAFFEGCSEDPPLKDNIELVQALADKGKAIIILSGRNHSAYADTLAWLSRNHVPVNNLKMRPEDDRRPDDELKHEYLQELKLSPQNTLAVIEDRDGPVRMYRERGFTVWQVADGTY